MIILYLRGWNSLPGGVKPSYLREHGHEVIDPTLDDEDFEAALKAAQAHYDAHQPDVVVGSSRGGAIAMNIESAETPLVLLCPAWKKWGTAKKLKSKAMILHSRQDDVIALEDSEELVAVSGLARETLVEVGQDHRLADDDSLSVILWACQWLVSGESLPALDDDARSPNHPPGGLQSPSQVEASYICDACGEEIVIPLDLSEGSDQQYVEDCPVCCRANMIHVHLDEDGTAQVSAAPEQDYDS
jgi:Cysteine-rich CPXCG